MIFAALGGALFKTATAKVIGGLAGAALDTVMEKKQVEKQNQAQEAAYQRQLEAERLEAEKNRALAKSDAANKFTDMSAAAQKAGINPLTALRTTGAAGFGNYGGFASQAVAPVLSKFSFARTFASNAAKGYFDRKTNEPIDKYNKKIRELEIQQRIADLKMTRGQIGQLSSGGFSGGARPTLDAPPEVLEILENAQSLDPRRGVEAAPITSGAGITLVDTPALGRIFMPGADGEPWGIDELMTAVISTPYSKAGTALGRLYPKEPSAPKDGTINIASRLRERLKLERKYNPDFGKLSWPGQFGGGGFAPSM